MAVNKLALIRYKAINDCLRNRYRRWTLEDLIEKVGDVLYESEGIASGVSRRTIQADIQFMRSDKAGYNAPIVVVEKKYYSYSDHEYSITNAPITEADILRMREVVGVLKQFNTFNYFGEMSEMIAMLENNLNRSISDEPNVIQFEDNRLLKGIEYIGPVYHAIANKKSLLIEYKSFRATNSAQQIYYPYLLKEFRNRWFLLTKAKKGKTLLTLALDRIIDVQELPQEKFVAYEGIDFDRYFSDLIGVTKNEKDRARKVLLQFDARTSPYVITKPLHHSQQVMKEDESGTIIRIDVVLNFELEREILGFGECVKVLSPRDLAGRINARIRRMARAIGDSGATASES
ncbi:MAG: WYL domain-containing protein [Flavitalea sp.]